MKRTLMDWRGSLGVCLLSCATFAAPSWCIAQDSTPPNGQQQQVDPAKKKRMAADGLYTRGLFKLAAQEYAELLDQYPTSPDAITGRYLLGVCRYRLHEYDKAVDQLRQVIADQKFEQRDEALAVLGHCELSQQHYEQALAAFDELLNRYPASKHAELTALNRAQVLYLAKKYPEAEKACDAYLSKYPDGSSRADALYFLGLSERAENHNGPAVQTLRQLTTTYPDSGHQVDALLLMGQAYEADGKMDAAVETYRQMLAAAPEPRKADAQYSLGLALYKSGKYPEASRELETLVAAFPNSSYVKSARLQLGMAQLAAGKTNEARNTLTAVAREDTERAAEAQYGLAQCEIADKRYDQARNLLDELLRVQPPPANIAQVALDHAVCTMELRQFQQASDELDSFRSKYPTAPQLAEATYRQAFCLHKLSKYGQSHDLCQESAKLKSPDLAPAIAELDAEDLFLLAKYPEAEKQFAALAQAAKDDSQRARFTFRRGQCEYFAGQYQQAVEILQPLASDPNVEKNQELHPAVLLLGDALLQQGKNAEAIPPLRRYLQIASAEHPQAEYKLGIAQLHANDVDSARQAFDRATQGPNDSPWVQRAWFERGQLDLKQKQYDQAAKAFRSAVTSSTPAEVAGPAAYQLGWAEFEAKHYPQAAAAWKEMASRYPKDKLAADAQFQQGVALREARQLAEAADAFQAYASAHPDGPQVIKSRQLAAACLKDLGRNDDARRMLSELADSAKGSGADAVLYDLAWAQRDGKDPAAAQATYRRLISEHADSKLAPAARTELAELLYNDNKYDQAAVLLEQVVNDKSADAKVISMADYRLGWCYEKLNKPDKAAATFAAYTIKGGGSDEMNASALLQAGAAYAGDGKYDKAAQSLADMLSKYPNGKDAPVAMLKLGEVQAEQNHYEDSGRTYSQFLDKYSTSEFAYRARFGIAWSLENQKKYDEARKAYQQVIAATNGETAARAQFQIGETYLGEGKFEQAVPALLAVEDVYAYPRWSARALFEAGRAFEQLKQGDQARKQYTQIINKYKDAPEAEMATNRLKGIAG